MIDKGSIGCLVLGWRHNVMVVRIAHDERKLEAVLTLREARMARDRMDEIIGEMENDVPADEVVQTPTPRVRTRRRSKT